jgi:prevent-host-death family protein
MIQVTIEVAKSTLSKLIEAALAGEDVVIASGAKPLARLVPVAQGPFQIGLLKEYFTEPGPDFLGGFAGGDA